MSLFGRVARLVVQRPLATVAVVGALALVGFVLALGLEPSASTDTLVGRNTAAFKATERFRKQFGSESVIVLVKGNLQRTVLTPDLARLIGLEGCLSGKVPSQALRELPPECTTLARLKLAKVVYGPGTFIHTAAEQIQKGFHQQQDQTAIQGREAANAARAIAKKEGLSRARQDKVASDAEQLAYQSFLRQALTTALKYNLMSVPEINNPQFVSELVFDPTRGVGVPKPRFAFLFPSPNSALIQIRLKPGLSDTQVKNAIRLFKSAAAEPRFAMAGHQRYIVTGIPVVVDALASTVQHSIFILLGAALLIMAATLALVFRTRMRLLPLALALAAAAMTYGFIALVGYDLTMASIAALPVLIGLAVDYAIQLQARFDESREERLRPGAAATAATLRGGPVVAGAGLATAAGFLVLLLSPVPMVHGFAVPVIVGIVLGLACAITAGIATLARFTERKPAAAADVPPMLPRLRARARSTWERIAWRAPGDPV